METFQQTSITGMGITYEESDHYMKQTVKASVFEDLFSNKEYLLQLYQALHPEDTTVLESDLEYVTLQQVMANNPYNDLGFKVGSRLMIRKRKIIRRIVLP